MIEIRTLGRTSVAVNGEPVTGEAAWPKSLALLVYMAREPGPDRREEILGVLWPDREEKRARRALNQLLYTLRKASPELDLESVSGAIDFGREVWLDVEEFENRLEAGDVEGALALYEGPFLVDLRVDAPEFDHWADRQRADLARKYRRAALQLAAQAKDAGRCEQAIAQCRRIVDADPLDDEAQHLLIECLHLRGNRVAALRQFDAYREVLARELNVEPLDHTRELVARIRGEMGPEAAPPQPVTEPTAEDEEAPRPFAEPAGPPLPSPGRPPRPRRWMVYTALGAIPALALAIWLWPKNGTEIREGAVASGTAGLWRVAVFPFNPHGLSDEDEGRPEGVAQLLALDLEREGVTIVPYREVLRAWSRHADERAPALSLERLRSLAAELKGNGIIIGDIHASGPDYRIVAELYGSEGGEWLARFDVGGPRDSTFAMVEQLAADLAEVMNLPSDAAVPR